jgi:hypothetical protein
MIGKLYEDDEKKELVRIHLYNIETSSSFEGRLFGTGRYALQTNE